MLSEKHYVINNILEQKVWQMEKFRTSLISNMPVSQYYLPDSKLHLREVTFIQIHTV